MRETPKKGMVNQFLEWANPTVFGAAVIVAHNLAVFPLQFLLLNRLHLRSRGQWRTVAELKLKLTLRLKMNGSHTVVPLHTIPPRQDDFKLALTLIIRTLPARKQVSNEGRAAGGSAVDD
ncbi:hypothetical protein NADE_008340 [Nannochloris sp. 'desiccata']|nr:hypothetical protein NADE_008340 [Chlorella desiccata (nom. nud.)]